MSGAPHVMARASADTVHKELAPLKNSSSQRSRSSHGATAETRGSSFYGYPFWGGFKGKHDEQPPICRLHTLGQTNLGLWYCGGSCLLVGSNGSQKRTRNPFGPPTKTHTQLFDYLKIYLAPKLVTHRCKSTLGVG